MTREGMNLKTGPGYVWVDDAQALARLTEALRGVSRVGLDTEADSLHHYFEKVCLIQLSFSGSNYIVDPLAGLSLTEFLAELSRKELILQGADYDLRMMKQSFGFRPEAPVFDTMLAAQVLGYEQIGLAALAEKFCGVTLAKAGQKSDWSKRPLPVKLLEYAASDVNCLERIADGMTDELRRLARTEWHRECCERVVKVTGLPEREEGKDPWRIKGSSKLLPKTLAFVREIWKWREEEARERDRPPFMILLNENLIALAEWRVSNPGTPLCGGPAFLRRVTGERLSRLENAVRFAENLPPSAWPERLKRTWAPDGRPSQEKVEALIAACRTIAEGLKISPSFLAPRAALTAVVRQEARSADAVMTASGLMRWQTELVMPAVKTVL